MYFFSICASICKELLHHKVYASKIWKVIGKFPPKKSYQFSWYGKNTRCLISSYTYQHEVGATLNIKGKWNEVEENSRKKRVEEKGEVGRAVSEGGDIQGPWGWKLGKYNSTAFCSQILWK